MKKVIDYKVLTNSDNILLSDNVLEHMEIGWQPQGGVSMIMNGTYSELWAQAIVKYEDTP